MDKLPPKLQALLDWIEDYILKHGHSPTIRQMQAAMGLRSPSPIQYRLKRLQDLGQIEWTKGHFRTIRLVNQPSQWQVPIKGEIAAGSLVETFPDETDHIDLSSLLSALRLSLREAAQCFALRVRGDSMIGAMIDTGDLVVLKPPADPRTIKNGTIVAARVDSATTLKHFHRQGNQVTLEAANPRYAPIEVNAEAVDVQGVFVTLLRGI